MQADEEHEVEASHCRKSAKKWIEEGKMRRTHEIGRTGVYLDEMLGEALAKEYGGNIGSGGTGG